MILSPNISQHTYHTGCFLTAPLSPQFQYQKENRQSDNHGYCSSKSCTKKRRELEMFLFGTEMGGGQLKKTLVACVLCGCRVAPFINFQIVYLDFSPTSLAIAQARAEARNLNNIRWVVITIIAFPTILILIHHALLCI